MKPETLKKKAAEYNKRFDAELGHEWERLSEYQGQKAMLTARHIPCGIIRTAPAGDFFRRGCYECQKAKGVRRRYEKRAAQYIHKIETEYNVTAASEYKGYREPMTWRCNVCGAEIIKTIDSVLFRSDGGEGLKCDHGIKPQKSEGPKATGKRLAKLLRRRLLKMKREEEILALCIQYEATGYDTLKIGDNLRTVRLRHLKCGREFTTTKDHMKRGYGCRACSRCGTSYGVQQIENYLRDHHIKFDREATFTTCKRKNVLPFDFAIYDSDGSIKFLIEFQGEQHYRARPMFGGEEKLQRVQEADAIKRQWARDNNVNLIIIDWNEDIEAALTPIEEA